MAASASVAHAVKLACKTYPVGCMAPNTGGNLYIAHGLLGNAMNWATPSRRLAEHPQLKDVLDAIYTLDMRNHGDSPHTGVHDNDALAADLEATVLQGQRDLAQKALHTETTERNSILLGHSMGGLAVMGTLLRRYNEHSLLPTADSRVGLPRCVGWDEGKRMRCSRSMVSVNTEQGFAPTEPLRDVLFADSHVPAYREHDMAPIMRHGRVAAAIIVDITPTVYLDKDDQNPTSVRRVLEMMSKVNLDSVSSYTDASSELERVGVADKSMRDFLLTNVQLKPDRSGPASWKCNLPVLLEGYGDMVPSIVQWFLAEQTSKADQVDVPAPCTLPVLFVFGERSPYNDPAKRKLLRLFFPSCVEAEVKRATHFVHYENTQDFVNLAAHFIATHLHSKP